MDKFLYYDKGDYYVYLKAGFYENGRIAIRALDEEGYPAFTATVNLPDENIRIDQAFIKDYAENEGVLTFLRKIGVIVSVVRYVNSGYVNIPLCDLNLKRLNELTEE